MNKILVFVYAFIIFMILDISIIIYLLTTQCHHDPAEYQLTIEDDNIVVKDYGRHVTTLSLDSTYQLGDILVKDNE